MKKKLNFGVIGVGYFGKNYVRLLQNRQDANLVSTADNLKNGLKLLHLPEIDCVIIATPASSHFQLASEAIKAGKHVFLEKPLAVKLSEAYELEKYVRKSKKIFLLGHQYLYNDYIKHLKQKLDSKILGEIKYVFAENFYSGPVRKDIGCFWETAGHELSILDYLLGPLKTADVTGHSAHIDKRKRDDFAVVTIRLKNGILINMAVSWFMPEKTRSIIIAGTKGTALFDDVLVQDKLKFLLNPYPKNLQDSSYFFPANDKAIQIPKINAKEPLYNELSHFIDCVKNNKIPLTDIKHGIRITKILQQVSAVL